MGKMMKEGQIAKRLATDMKDDKESSNTQTKCERQKTAKTFKCAKHQH